MKAIYLCDHSEHFDQVWASEQKSRLRSVVDISDRMFKSDELPAEATNLKDVEVAFSTWGMPALTEEQLDYLPNLRAVFYAAGTTRNFALPFLKRNILVVNAAAANAVPVAEFTLSQILFALKFGWQQAMALKNGGPENWKRRDMPGVYENTIGIISLGLIGRKVCELLRPFVLKKLAFDPHASAETFQSLDVKSASLESLFAESEVVTLHAPWLPQTEGLITGKLIASMKPNATFINTSRGAIVNEPEMIEVLKQRPDLMAVLDVSNPEPPVTSSPLYTLPNVILTPHIAGSMGKEVRRMSDMMIDEFIAWTKGHASPHTVTFETLEKSA
ncbi:MAG: hydroxyacid dehydrogenase [Chthoniobacterales bacterium]